MVALRMTRCGFQIDQVNIAALDQISSFPTAGAPIHSRSCAGSGYALNARAQFAGVGRGGSSAGEVLDGCKNNESIRP